MFIFEFNGYDNILLCQPYREQLNNGRSETLQALAFSTHTQSDQLILCTPYYTNTTYIYKTHVMSSSHTYIYRRFMKCKTFAFSVSRKYENTRSSFTTGIIHIIREQCKTGLDNSERKIRYQSS